MLEGKIVKIVKSNRIILRYILWQHLHHKNQFKDTKTLQEKRLTRIGIEI